jgi:PAS domain S-box-containing protein
MKVSVRRRRQTSPESGRGSVFDSVISDQELACSLLPVIRDLPVGIVVTDARGNLSVFNDEAEKILGMGPTHVGPERWSEVYGCYLPDKVTPFPSEQLPLARALRGEEVRDELIFIRNHSQPDGVWIRASAKPLKQTNKGGRSAVVVLQNVTERRKAGERIDLLSRAVEQTADSVLVTDTNGTIEYVNPAFEATTGYTRAEAVGNNPRMLRSGQHTPEFYRDMWQQILGGEVFRGTLINRKKTGELYWTEQTITPVKDATGSISHFVSVLKDVTEARKEQEHEIQLQLARRVQQRFYTPAMSLHGLDLGAAVYSAAETGGDYVDFIRRSHCCVDIAVGDVSGHGFDSALVMALTRAYVRALSACLSGVSEMMRALNLMFRDDLYDNRYVTLLFARVDAAQRTVSYASAGHVPGVMLDESGKIDFVLESTGLPLGLFDDCNVEACTVPLKPGSTVMFLTDGVTEAENVKGDSLSHEQIAAYVHAQRDLSAQQIADSVCQYAQAFEVMEEQRDDITAVILKAA